MDGSVFSDHKTEINQDHSSTNNIKIIINNFTKTEVYFKENNDTNVIGGNNFLPVKRFKY